MSRIIVNEKFRKAWNESKYLSTPTDDQLNEFIDRTCDEITSRRRNDGQITSITVNVGEQEIPLKIDWISTAHNDEILRKIEEGLSPYSRNYGVQQLNYQGFSYPSGRGFYDGLNNNLSQPLRPASPKMRKPQIKRKKIDGVDLPVWVLYQPAAKGGYFKDITYQGRHRIENANCLLSINSNPSDGDQLIVDHNNLDEAIALTFVDELSEDATNEIKIGESRIATMENIKSKLVNELFFDVTKIKNRLFIIAPDGDDFTLVPNTADEDIITRVYTSAVNTIPFQCEVYFYQILEAFALRGMKSQRLLEGQSISDIETIASNLLTEALNAITSRSS